MAITATARGTGGHTSSSTSFTAVPASNLASGSMAVLLVVMDIGATVPNAISGITDTNGNTWTIRQSPFVSATAGRNTQGVIATTPMDGGTLTTGSTITVSFPNSATVKLWALLEVIGTSLVYVTGNMTGGTSASSGTITTSSITNGNIVIGLTGIERGSPTITPDGDTSNGNWSTHQTTTGGSLFTGQALTAQYKVVTATATQTYNTSWGISTLHFLTWIELRESTTSLKDIINGFGIIPYAR